MRLLHATIPLVVMSTAGSVRADSFGELLGGISIPVADDNWTNLASSSPKLAARAGATGDAGLGGMLSIDWTPVNLNNSGGSFGIGSADVSGQRFRFLADLVYHHPIAAKLVVSARVGAGLDLAHASVSATVLGTTTNTSDTNAGFGFELGGGLWYDLGSVQIGGEIALPISTHSKHGTGADGNYTFDYTSYDIDLLFGVRLLSGRS